MLTTLRPLFAFGLLITTAALVYPGGTWRERSSAGFSFWHNFWCDLLSERALNGRSNLLGSILARLAFACFALALYRFWSHASERAGAAPLHHAARRLGRFGAVSLLAVALVPAATSQRVHGVAVVLSAATSVTCVLLLLRGLARRGEQTAAALAIGVVVSALVCLGQYVYQGCFAGADAVWLAGMQKITTALLLAFMVRLSVRGEGADDASTTAACG